MEAAGFSSPNYDARTVAEKDMSNMQSTMNDKEDDADHNNNSRECPAFRRMKNQNIPIANITRIMQRILPSRTRISFDSKEAVHNCVSEFITFVTSEAKDHCKSEQRKIVTAEDLLWAMNNLGFHTYAVLLNVYLNRFRAAENWPSLRAENIMECGPGLNSRLVGHQQ
uniref:LEC1 protein n=1 Tax=Paeonia ostii TaxID=459177 RepID=A0A9E8CZC6_9MAGN|nr:LEC1 protein [Paeonia ostii]